MGIVTVAGGDYIDKLSVNRIVRKRCHESFSLPNRRSSLVEFRIPNF